MRCRSVVTCTQQQLGRTRRSVHSFGAGHEIDQLRCDFVLPRLMRSLPQTLELFETLSCAASMERCANIPVDNNRLINLGQKSFGKGDVDDRAVHGDNPAQCFFDFSTRTST
jgi:hypothetical protein